MKRKVLVGAAALALLAAACGSSSKHPTTSASTTSGYERHHRLRRQWWIDCTGVTATTIKIGLVTDLTGGLSSSFEDTPVGVKGVFNMINAQGGVDGRKLELVTADTGSSPTQGLTAVQSLISQGVFAIISISGVAPLGAYHILHTDDIPVFGESSDGPEWSDPVNGWNLFDNEAADGQYPAATTMGGFMKQHGVTKLAVVCYGSIPSSANQCHNYIDAAKSVGIPTVYQGINVQIAQANFAAQALGVKSSGANGVVGVMAESADLGLSTALSENGLKPVEIYAGVGYDSQTLADPTTKAAAEGDYFTVIHQPIETNTPAMQTWVQELKQYADVTGIPGFAVSEGWESAGILVAALQHNGADLTRANLVKNTHTLDGFTDDGVLSSAINYSTGWGHGTSGLDQNDCVYVVQLSGTNFLVQNNNKPYCGTVIPDTANSPSNPAPSGASG